GQRAEQIGQPRVHAIRRPRRPPHVLEKAEHDEPQRDPDQSIADHGGAHRGPEALDRRLVEGDPDLRSAAGDPGGAEVEPRGHRGPAPKTSQNPPRPWTLGKAYTRASRPIRPPTAAPPKRRSPFWLLDPMVESEMTKQGRGSTTKR